MTENGHNDAPGREAKQKAESLASEMKQKGKALLSEGWESAREVFDEQSRVIRSKAEEIGDKSVEELSADFKRYVKAHPFKSLGMGVAFGFLLGLIYKD